jgi:hypothetical protein
MYSVHAELSRCSRQHMTDNDSEYYEANSDRLPRLNTVGWRWKVKIISQLDASLKNDSKKAASSTQLCAINSFHKQTRVVVSTFAPKKKQLVKNQTSSSRSSRRLLRRSVRSM